MKIAILGGGLTGLTAAYYLSKKKHQITVFEKEKILGGMAAGFKTKNWDWHLEKTVHHLFANDREILNLAKEIGFNKIFFRAPETASLYQISKTSFDKLKTASKIEGQIKNKKYSIYTLASPRDLLKFPLLSWKDKLNAGLVLAFLKLSPPLKLFEATTAEKFLVKFMGKNNWEVLWQELFRKKFGKYAGNILASFIWARVKKRTKKLGYIAGGFQNLINHIEEKLINSKVNLLKGYEIKRIEKKEDGFIIDGEVFDAVISTLPTPILIQIAKQILPKAFISRLSKVQFLHAISLVIESEKPIFNKTYWMNILAREIPIMGLFQQTNFIDKINYDNKHILYCGWYTTENDKLWLMGKDEIIDYISPYLNKISNPSPRGRLPLGRKFKFTNSWLFKIRFAQPIFDKEFLKNKPEFITPVKNFYLATLDMTYPYDRGTNFAVKLGKEAAVMI